MRSLGVAGTRQKAARKLLQTLHPIQAMRPNQYLVGNSEGGEGSSVFHTILFHIGLAIGGADCKTSTS